MAGDHCVGIACDRRLGRNQLQTIASTFPKVFQVTDKTLVGIAGLATDVQTLRNHLRFRMNLYSLKEDRDMKPEIVSNLLGTTLYGRRFAPWFISPVVAGLDETNQPHLSTFDFLGARCKARDFVVAGTTSEQLYGLCESFWKENMTPEELSETLSQCLLAGIDRDCLAGWGAMVYIMTPDKLITRTLKTRMD